MLIIVGSDTFIKLDFRLYIIYVYQAIVCKKIHSRASII